MPNPTDDELQKAEDKEAAEEIERRAKREGKNT